jgi:hypothetical protein
MLLEDHMSFSGCQHSCWFLAAELEFLTRMIMSVSSSSSVIASQDLFAVGSCPEQQNVSNWVCL